MQVFPREGERQHVHLAGLQHRIAAFVGVRAVDGDGVAKGKIGRTARGVSVGQRQTDVTCLIVQGCRGKQTCIRLTDICPRHTIDHIDEVGVFVSHAEVGIPVVSPSVGIFHKASKQTLAGLIRGGVDRTGNNVVIDHVVMVVVGGIGDFSTRLDGSSP